MTDQEKEMVIDLYRAYAEYVELLGKELGDVSGLAHVHGWRSQRINEGQVAREKINKAKNKLHNHVSFKDTGIFK